MARSKAKKIENMRGSGHFWRDRCRKTVMRREAHAQVKMEVAMLKMCTPLLRQAHFQHKVYTGHHSVITFGRSDVEKVHGVAALSTFSKSDRSLE